MLKQALNRLIMLFTIVEVKTCFETFSLLQSCKNCNSKVLWQLFMNKKGTKVSRYCEVNGHGYTPVTTTLAQMSSQISHSAEFVGPTDDQRQLL